MSSLVDCAQIAQQKPPSFKIKRKKQQSNKIMNYRWCDILKMEPKKPKETKEWKIFGLIVTDNFPKLINILHQSTDPRSSKNTKQNK